MVREPCVYILASQKRGTLYIGVTCDLVQRMYEHREGVKGGFTDQYNVKRLVHVERFDTMADAIAREKQLKNWQRVWKIELIEAGNPEWRDVAVEFGFAPLRRG